MKRTYKALLLVLCAVLLVAASVMGTLAYLTSTTGVAKNTFTYGDVQITLDEFDYDNDENTKDNTTVNGEARDMANEYHLLPGGEYTKDPTVTVLANSEDCYVRMFVTVNKISQLKAAFDSSYVVNGIFLLQNLVDWNTDWEYVNCVQNGNDDTAVYEFRYNAKVLKQATDNRLPALFTTISIPEGIDNEHIALLGAVVIDVDAQAMQATGFDNAADAWDNWPTTNN